MAGMMRAKPKQSAKGSGRPQNKLGGGVVSKFGNGVGKGSSGKGKPNGQWVFVPDAPKFAPVSRVVRHAAPAAKKPTFSEKIEKIDASKKVWIGGLPKDTTWQKLREHLKDVAHSSITEVSAHGNSACVAFKTCEDAENVIATLNGSDFGGNNIKIDVWTQREKKEPKVEGKKGKQVAKTQPLVKSKFAAKVAQKAPQKDQKQDRGNVNIRDKLKDVDHSLKVWIGGLAPKTNWKQIKTHFVDAGCEPDLINLMKNDTAIVAFKTADDAETAISILNGTELDGKSLHVDTWTKPERKEKKNKGKED